ncbi:uncharacterized protein TNCV_3747101 [Trichonephila clavipes]|nr:uncharacterized protein TNCV_3747101 [Trichonephila clavipes]
MPLENLVKNARDTVNIKSYARIVAHTLTCGPTALTSTRPGTLGCVAILEARSKKLAKQPANVRTLFGERFSPIPNEGCGSPVVKAFLIEIMELSLSENGTSAWGQQDSNLKKLERIQLSAARIIAGLRNSCPNNLVLYECNIQPLSMRRNYCLTKYFNKLLSYGDQHRTYQHLKHWKDNQMLKRNSPFSQALAQNLSFNVEHHCLTSFINPVLGLQGGTFHYNLMPNVNKMSEQPEPHKQLALEVINGIPLDATKIYTDGSKGETNITGSGVLIELPGHVIKFQRRNADRASVFRNGANSHHVWSFIY